MPGTLRRHLSYANVVSTICLFVVLGGSAYAAVSLARGSVKSRHIARNAVTSTKVRDQSLRARDFRAGELPAGARGEAGAAGPAGSAGEAGAAGATGPRGPSDAYSAGAVSSVAIGDTATSVASITLPAGSYVITGKASAFNNAANVASGDCALTIPGQQLDIGLFSLDPNGGALEQATVTVHTARTFATQTTVQLACKDLAANDVRLSDRRLTAIRVDALTSQ